MQQSRRRAGLAPLELVIWLPILLMVAALMVNIGTSTVWRIRGETVARDAVWRVRYPRSGAGEPRPPQHVWPRGANVSAGSNREIDQLDVGEIRHEVVRGPLPNGFLVRQILRPNQGSLQGESQIRRPLPMLSRLGNYDSGPINHPLLDRKWQAAEMGLPSNVYRRTKALYVFPKTDPSLPAAFRQALQGVFSIPHQQGLQVLDRDPDVRRYYGYYVDFHPRINRYFCELDRDLVRERQVKRLIDRLDRRGEVRLGEISRLPRRLTNFFLNMYRRALERLEQLVETQGPTPALLAEIAELEEKISQLEAYAGRLDGIEERLRQTSPALEEADGES